MVPPYIGQYYRHYTLQTPTYNLANLLVPLLNPLTKKKDTLKDYFQFAEEICQQDPTLSMGSLDVDWPTFLSMRLLIFVSISYLKILILLKVLRSQKLNNCYVMLQRNHTFYLTAYFTSNVMLWQWTYLLDLPLLTHFFQTMKKAG